MRRNTGIDSQQKSFTEVEKKKSNSSSYTRIRHFSCSLIAVNQPAAMHDTPLPVTPTTLKGGWGLSPTQSLWGAPKAGANTLQLSAVTNLAIWKEAVMPVFFLA